METKFSFQVKQSISKIYVIIILLLLLPVKIQYQNSLTSLSWSSSVIQQNCFTNEKIESITGKKRSVLSPKVVKAWKQGSFNLVHDKSCGLAIDFSSQVPTPLWSSWLSNKPLVNQQVALMLEKVELLSNEKNITENAKVKKIVKAKPRIQTDIQASREFSDIAGRLNFASRCEKKFVSDSGFGPLGQVVKETLTRGSVKDIIRYDTSFGGACPGYRSMNAEQRKNIWVFIVMSMSHYESSCKEKALNQGPYGLAVGLLQLHEQNEDLYAKWDPDFNCDKGASQSARKSIKCALTMIGHQIYRGVPFFNDNSHWQVLRKVDKPGTQAYHIRYAISQIADCKANPLYFDFDFKVESKKKTEVHHSNRPPGMELALLK